MQKVSELKRGEIRVGRHLGPDGVYCAVAIGGTKFCRIVRIDYPMRAERFPNWETAWVHPTAEGAELRVAERMRGMCAERGATRGAVSLLDRAIEKYQEVTV